MTLSVDIRPITKDDRDEWQPLWRAYLEFYETSVGAEVYDTSFARLLKEDDHEFNGMIAHRDGVAIGIVHYLFHRHMWRIENVCYLQDLYVSPQARGTGAGRALIEAVYKAADAKGCPSVYWLTQDFNHTARQLYDRIAANAPFTLYRRVL